MNDCRYYVLGYDEQRGAIVILSGRSFVDKSEAEAFADNCDKIWEAFVVQEIAK